MNAAVMFSKATDEWATPQAVFDALDDEFSFDLDAAASPSNRKCGFYFAREDDALAQDWQYPGGLEWLEPATVWLNPPYSRCREFIAKAAEEARKGCTVVCLVPARTDTRWFHQYIYDETVEHADGAKGAFRPGVEVRFLKGRLKFGDSTNSAPFPSMVVIFRPVQL